MEFSQKAYSHLLSLKKVLILAVVYRVFTDTIQVAHLTSIPSWQGVVGHLPVMSNSFKTIYYIFAYLFFPPLECKLFKCRDNVNFVQSLSE